VGVEVTDSPYVVASMRIMSRMGKVAMERLGASSEFVPGLHSLGDLDPMRRYIVHFPQEKLIWSVGRVTAETRCWGKNVLRCGLRA